jgi:hypothetical protein
VNAFFSRRKAARLGAPFLYTGRFLNTGTVLAFRWCPMNVFQDYAITISVIVVLFVIGWILTTLEGKPRA